MRLDFYDIIKRPIITEKSNDLLENNKYTFAVALKANKIDIKNAIEAIFKVKVKDVNTMRMLGKAKRVGVHQGKKPDWKKAIVTLQDGHKIEFFEGM